MSLVQATRLRIDGRLGTTDLALDAGSLVCLVGPNGSGKTSLLHALARIGRGGGTVAIGGVAPESIGPGGRRRMIGFLPASRDLPWPLAGRDVIALGGDALQSAPLLHRLDLETLMERRMDRLSTGERARILIARALAPEPQLLLLDEPVSNLDPAWQLRLMQLLHDYASGGRAVVAAMHDLDLAESFADRLIVMRDGGVVADGAPAEIMTGPCIREVFAVERHEGRWRPV